MMNVLDALRYRLSATDTEGERIDPSLLEAMVGLRSDRDPRQQLPSWLPLGVQDQIRNYPSYSEGRVVPGPRNPLMEQEAAAGSFTGPQREAPLLGELDALRDILGKSDQPVPEGSYLSPRPQGQSLFASPLNQLMQLGRRAPLSMY